MPMNCLSRLSLAALALVVALPFAGGCRARKDPPVVVVYTALDRLFSEPILNDFEKSTGIRVLVKYDTESTKTVGLVNTIRAEKDRPRCDVFWNNEIVNTIRLKEEGLLQPVPSAAAGDIPPVFRDAEAHWVGFAARARVLLVNTNRIAAGQEPDSINSLADARWKGQTGIAKPLFGTTATHAACLSAALGPDKAQAFCQSLKDNDICIESGNRAVARGVAEGRLAFGLTDTDDAVDEVESGRPVKIVYPDARPDQLGVLFIPNTLSLVKGAPNPDGGRRLIEYLLSPEVEGRLALGKSAQIPLGLKVTVKARVRTPAEVKAMPVDFSRAAAQFQDTARYLEQFFLK